MSEYDARLADRVRTRGVLGPDDAARLLLPVADALAALHAAGSTHGALSPAAVRVDAAGCAALVEPGQVAPDPSYTAPDPSVGLRADPAADDVWSFAALLHFVTSGADPTPGRVLREIGWLAPITELALLVDPRERPSMADVAAYLRARFGGPEPAARHRRPAGAVLAIAGAAVIAGLALVGAALLFLGEEDGSGDGAATASSTGPDASAEADDDEGPAAPSAGSDAVSAGDLEDFARDYVALASRDPDRGFGMLTRSYQRESPRYREVWSAIREPRILAITPDPLAMSVSYTYRYALPGGRTRTEDVTLRLVQRAGRLLIAGASAR